MIAAIYLLFELQFIYFHHLSNADSDKLIFTFVNKNYILHFIQ